MKAEDKLTMRILALDSSTAACSAAIWDSTNTTGNVVARRFEAMERGQSEALAPMVDDVLGDAGMRVGDMDLLAVTTGPGAFTGVRIGLAMAQSLGLSSGVPVLGVSTMTAVAHGIPKSERNGAWIIVVMDTKREDVYVQAFDPSLSSLGQPDVIAPEDLLSVMDGIPEGETVLIAGDAMDVVSSDILESDSCHSVRVLPGLRLPDAAVVADVAACNSFPDLDEAPPSPLYLRPPYVKVSPTGGKLRP